MKCGASLSFEFTPTPPFIFFSFFCSYTRKGGKVNKYWPKRQRKRKGKKVMEQQQSCASVLVFLPFFMGRRGVPLAASATSIVASIRCPHHLLALLLKSCFFWIYLRYALRLYPSLHLGSTCTTISSPCMPTFASLHSFCLHFGERKWCLPYLVGVSRIFGWKFW